MNRKDILARLETANTSTDLVVIRDNLKPLLPLIDNDTLVEYVGRVERAIEAKGTPSYRGIMSALSPNSKLGQRYGQMLINLRIKYQTEAKAEVKEEKEAKIQPQIAALAAAHGKSKEAPKTIKVGGEVATLVTPDMVKVPKAKTEKTKSPCVCGCGELVAGDFKMGHDARVKGWLLKFVRGEGDFLTPSVLAWPSLPEKLVRWGIPNTDGKLVYGSDMKTKEV